MDAVRFAADAGSGRQVLDGRRQQYVTRPLAGYPSLLERLLVFVSRDSNSHPAIGGFRFCVSDGGVCGNAGLSEEEIARVAQGPDGASWSDLEATLVRAADELFRAPSSRDATWSALVRRFNDKRLLDLVLLVGQYDMISMYLKSAGVQLDEGVPRFAANNR